MYVSMYLCIQYYYSHTQTDIQYAGKQSQLCECRNRPHKDMRHLCGLDILFADGNQKVAGFDAAKPAGRRLPVDYVHSVHQTVVLVEHLCACTPCTSYNAAARFFETWP